RVVIEQRPGPLQREHEVGVLAVAQNQYRIGWAGPEVHMRNIAGREFGVTQRVPKVLVWRVRDPAGLTVLFENTVHVIAERCACPVVGIDYSVCHVHSPRLVSARLWHRPKRFNGTVRVTGSATL